MPDDTIDDLDEEIRENEEKLKELREKIREKAQSFGLDNLAVEFYKTKITDYSTDMLRRDMLLHLKKAKAAAEQISHTATDKGTSVSHSIIAQRIDDILGPDA